MAGFGRLLTAMVTPFDERGEVDYPQARRLARALLDSGNDGLVLAGTTGESPTLTHDEKLRLFAEVLEEVRGSGGIFAGTCNNNTRESIELSREAERLGVDGILGTVPYYNKPPQEGLYQHFKAIAEAVALPIMLYNVPGRTATNMLPETTIRLSEVDTIVGIKEASGNFEAIAKIIDQSRPGFRVWSGDDSATLPILSLGGYGVVSVVGHLVGAQIKRMIEAQVAGRNDEASALHRKLLPLFNSMFLTTNPIPVKYALNTVGFRVGSPRLPLVPCDAKTAVAIDYELARETIDLPVGVPA
jgi:4-hydroxy-tetrahydrodipicolinate synthase